MLIKFLVLTVNEVEFVAQYDLFEFNGIEFSISGVNKEVTEYLFMNKEDILNNSGSNIAIECTGNKFKVTLDEETPEFSYKGVSVSIQEMYVRPVEKDVLFLSNWEEGTITTKAKIHIDSGEVFDIESSDDGSEYETLIDQEISIGENNYVVYQNSENVFFVYEDDLKEIQALLWNDKE